MPSTTTLELWQDELLLSAKALVPTHTSEASKVLERDGVVRLQDCRVDPSSCKALRDQILKEINTKKNSDQISDKRYVPGTRLRLQQPIDLAFSGDVRHDLLLPIHNHNFHKLYPILTSIVTQLEPLLSSSTESLLPRLHDSAKQIEKATIINDSIQRTSSSLSPEVVEVASLVVKCGSRHQEIHGDYRRFNNQISNDGNNDVVNSSIGEQTPEPVEHTKARMGKLPPRLVTFIVLQDIPTTEHGATGFFTGTHTAKSHNVVYGNEVGSFGHESNVATLHGHMSKAEQIKVIAARQKLLDKSTNGVRTTCGFKTGDILVYDASVLHWGGANSVPNNDRAILYFGVARPGAAQILSGEDSEMKGFTAVPPVTLDELIS